MKFSKRYRDSENEDTQIDISPLIDVVFILVIFFVVTTIFNKESGLEVDRPPKQATTRELDASSVQIGLSASGKVMYGGRTIGVLGVEAAVAAVRDGGDPVPVVIICDKGANAADITKVIDAANRAEAKSVSISTKK